MTTKLIVALDFENQAEVFALVDQLDPTRCALKIGSELFTSFGPSLVKQLIAKKFKIFLDLKFHDIPNTVSKACKVAADLGVWMLNVHASGGFNMMQAAMKAIEPYGKDRPLLLAVTILTSFAEEELPSIGFHSSLKNHVNQLALLTKASGLDGVVCSAHEVPLIKEACGQLFIALTPGIRLKNSQANDQKRIMTPHEALSLGSDYLVIGRPISQAENPAKVLEEIDAEITKANIRLSNY